MSMDPKIPLPPNLPPPPSAGERIEAQEREEQIVNSIQEIREKDPEKIWTAQEWAEMLGIDPGEISTTEEEILEQNGSAIFHIGDVGLKGVAHIEHLIFPKILFGTIRMEDCVSGNGVIFPEQVYGSLLMNQVVSAKGMVLPIVVSRTLSFSGLKSGEGFVCPRGVQGNVYFNDLEEVKDMVFPEYIGGGLCCGSLTSRKGLVLPKKVKGTIEIGEIASAEEFITIVPEGFSGEFYMGDLDQRECEKIKAKYPNVVMSFKTYFKTEGGSSVVDRNRYRPSF